ncbi:MAG TPA: hypothetical protein VGI92_13630 [Gemmatimonadales bacterium]|jgi:hypothetical protein
MPELVIRIKKKTDGSAALSCERADKSVTWQRQEGAQGRFFPLHDLTHYAVETVLGHRRGFFGLVADGWNVTDFGAPSARGRIPAEAMLSELIVGFLDAERATADRWSAAEVNEKMRIFADENGLEQRVSLTDEELAAIRARRAELFARWREVPAGAALELPFDRSVTA